MCLVKVTSVACSAAAARRREQSGADDAGGHRTRASHPRCLLLAAPVGSLAPALRRTIGGARYPPPTVTVTSRADASPPSWAYARSTYVPGSWKIAPTSNRSSAGSGGGSQPGDQGELPS